MRQQVLIQLDLCPKTDAYVLALPASLPVRYAAVLTVINALVDFVARFPNPHLLLVVAGQDFGKLWACCCAHSYNNSRWQSLTK